jgi:hypothetical protein
MNASEYRDLHIVKGASVKAYKNSVWDFKVKYLPHVDEIIPLN